MDDETKNAIEAASLKIEKALYSTTLKLDELYAISYQMFEIQRSIYSAWSQAALLAMNSKRGGCNGR